MDDQIVPDTLGQRGAGPVAHVSPEPPHKAGSDIESGTEKTHIADKTEEADDSDVVDFTPHDPENPLNWPSWRKWTIVILVALMELLALLGTTDIVPAVPVVMKDLHAHDHKYYTLLVSIWELGEGASPFIAAPLSELYGRLPVYHVGNVLFLLCSIAAALSTNISMLAAFRFLNGLVLTALPLSSSIIGDLFERENRGTAMALAVAAPLTGPFIAPVVGSYTAADLGWRWVVWIVVIPVAGVTALSILLFRETYKVKIIQGKLKRLQKETGNASLRSKYDSGVTRETVIQSLLRPIRLMFLNPIVFNVTLYGAFIYGISYLILTTLTEVVIDVYGFPESNVGLPFLARAVGNILALILYGLGSDRYLKYKKAKRGVSTPEDRFPLLILGAILTPVGLFMYGWSAQRRTHWIVPLIGTGMTGFSMLLIRLSTDNYLVDVFDLHAASAVASGVILRAVFGALFPLAGPPLYHHLGYGWGNSVLAFIAIAFIPLLVCQMVFGERLRNKVK